MPQVALTSGELRRVARLARVGLEMDELRVLRGDLASVLDFARRVASAHPASPSRRAPGDSRGEPLREDRILDASDPDLLHRAAPQMRRGHVVVPRVL